MSATKLTWTRVQRGWYEATAPDDTRWRIVQTASARWEVLRNSPPFSSYEVVYDWPHTLADAKWYAEEEADPDARARREARRARRDARSASRVMGSDAARAVGRFNEDGPDGYRAATASDAPLRATREEAVEDERAWLDHLRYASPPCTPHSIARGAS